MKAKYAGRCIICTDLIDVGSEIFQPKTGTGVAHNYCLPLGQRYVPTKGKQYLGDLARLCGARTSKGNPCRAAVAHGGRCWKHVTV